MPKYLKLCTDCKNSCKQKAGAGIKIIKCPMYEPKNSPLAIAEPANELSEAGNAIKPKGN